MSSGHRGDSTVAGSGGVIRPSLAVLLFASMMLSGAAVFPALAPMDIGPECASSNLVASFSGLPPEITSPLPTQTKAEDYGSWTLNITTYVTDRDDNISQLKWYAVNETLVTVSGENRTGNMVMTFATVKDMFGTDVIEVRVVDSGKSIARANLTIQLVPVNDPPWIDKIDPIVVRYGSPYLFNATPYVHDVDDAIEDLVLSVDGTSANYVTVHGPWLEMVYPESLNGTEQVVLLTATDGEFAATAVIVVSVTGNLIPSVLAPLPNLVMDQGETVLSYFNLSDFFVWPGGELQFRASGYENVEVVIRPDNCVDFLAPTTWHGEEDVVFKARTNDGSAVESSMLVTVIAVNQPPVISGVPDLTVRYGQEYVLDLGPYVYDIDDDLGDLTVATNDTHVLTSGIMMTVLYTASMLGLKVSVNLTVSDGYLTDSWAVNVTVSDDLPPETVCQLPAHSFFEDSPTTYPVSGRLNDYFTDPNGDQLSFTAFVYSRNVTAETIDLNGNWNIHFHADQNWNGMTGLTIRGVDSEGAFVEATVLLTVTSVPDGPSLDIPASFAVTQGSYAILDITENVSDPDSSLSQLSFEVASGYPDCVSIHNGVLVFDFPTTFLEGEEKSKDIVVTVTVLDQDGLSSVDSVTVTVSKASGTSSDTVLLLALLATGAAATAFFVLAVVRRKRPFVVRDMMMIHNDGFLIGRYATPVAGEIDDQVLSGMLAAVLNFVEDSMSTSHGTLTSFGFGEYQVRVQRGEKAFAAVVFEGDAPDGVEAKLDAFVKKFERIYRKKLVRWSGDIDKDFAGADLLIRTWVGENSRRARTGPAEEPWKVDREDGEVTAK